MDIRKLINEYISKGYSPEDAESKVAQDIILLAITNSRFSSNITIKGGVVMHSISNDIRRATRDLDLDFIKYSLEDESIRNFIFELNKSISEIEIKIIRNIKPLHHQDYDGKRVYLKMTDSTHFFLTTKLDIGVYKNFDIEQDEYCFNLDIIGKNANLLINSKEQIFSEKLKSLLRLGALSTRYKDLFDFYYLIKETDLDKNKLCKCIDILIFNDETMRENNFQDISHRLNFVLHSKNYRNNLTDPKVNWLDVSVDDAIKTVLDYVSSLEAIPV